MKNKKVYKLIFSIFVMVMCVSILLMQIPPKPVEAFAVPLAVPVIVGVGALLAAAGYTVYTNTDMTNAVYNLWGNLEQTTKDALESTFNSLNPLEQTVVTINRLVWDTVADKVKQLYMKDPATNPGITSQTQTVTLKNGNEFYRLSTDAFNYYSFSTTNTWINVTSKTVQDIPVQFTNMTGNLHVDYDTWLTIDHPDGYQIMFFTTKGIDTYTNVPWNFHLLDPVVTTDATTSKKDLTFRFEMDVLAGGGFIESGIMGPSLINYNYNGTLITGNLNYDTGSNRVFINYNSNLYYLSEPNQFDNVHQWVYNIIYGTQVVAYDQDADYIPYVGIKSMDTLIGEEDDAQILVPPVGAVDNVIGYTPAQAIPDVLDDAIPATIDVTLPTEVPITDNPDVEQMKLPIVLMNKFPFCIPFDLAKAFGSLQAAPQAPRFEVPFEIASLNYSYNFVLDLDDFNGVVKIARWFILLAFIITLIMATRGLIKG